MLVRSCIFVLESGEPLLSVGNRGFETIGQRGRSSAMPNQKQEKDTVAGDKGGKKGLWERTVSGEN